MCKRTVSVQRIAEKGMPDMAHMDPDLVGTTCHKGQADKRVSFVLSFHFIGCEGRIASVFRDPLNITVERSHDRGIHISFGFGKFPLAEREIHFGSCSLGGLRIHEVRISCGSPFSSK